METNAVCSSLRLLGVSARVSFFGDLTVELELESDSEYVVAPASVSFEFGDTCELAERVFVEGDYPNAAAFVSANHALVLEAVERALPAGGF